MNEIIPRQRKSENRPKGRYVNGASGIIVPECRKSDTSVESKVYEFYMGLNKCTLYISNNPVDYIYEYVKTCLVDVNGYIRDEEFDLINNEDCYPKILTQLICCMLRYNGFAFDPTKVYVSVKIDQLALVEPSIIVERKDERLVIYYSKSIMNEYLKMNTPPLDLNWDMYFENNQIMALNTDDFLTNIPLSVDDNKHNDAESSYYSLTSYGEMCDRDKSKSKHIDYTNDLILKLFVVADHAVTHLLEKSPNKSIVYGFMNHHGFGKTNINTLHSAFQISGYQDAEFKTFIPCAIEDPFILPNSTLSLRDFSVTLNSIRR